MADNHGEDSDALKRLSHLEVLFMDLERTVQELSAIVRHQQTRLEELEQTVRRWQASGIGEEEAGGEEAGG